MHRTEKSKKTVIRVGVDSIDPELLAKIEQAASERGISVSAFVKDVVARETSRFSSAKVA